jgi:tetratricopeptide (TPR) repeat protein
VAHWALLDFGGERASYQKALTQDPMHLEARIYLGHNYLDHGQWSNAIAQYKRVLELDNDNPEALYNQGLAQRGAGDSAGEADAWARYLSYHRSGEKACRAVERLNAAGDFRFRLYALGGIRVVLPQIRFLETDERPDEESRKTLDFIGRLLLRQPDLKLHVVVYEKGHSGMARRKAEQVRTILAGENNDQRRYRLRISWFGRAETIPIGGKVFKVDRSVRIYTDVAVKEGRTDLLLKPL